MEIIIILWIFLSKSHFLNYDASIKIYTTVIGFIVAMTIPIFFIIKNILLNSFKIRILNLNNMGQLSYISFLLIFIISILNNIRINDISPLEKPISLLAILMIISYGLFSSQVFNKNNFIKRFNQISYISIIINLIFLLFLHDLSWDGGRFKGYLSDPAIMSSLSIIITCFLTPRLFQTDKLALIRFDIFFLLLNFLFAYLSGSRSCIFIILVLTLITLFANGYKYKLKFKSNNKSIFRNISLGTTPFIAILGYFMTTGLLTFGPRLRTQNAFNDRFTQWSYAFIDPKWFEGIGLTAKFVLDDVGETAYTHFLDPHNLYLSTALNLGMLSGLIMFIGTIIILFNLISGLSIINQDYCFYLLVFSIILISPIGGSMFSLNNIYDRTAWVSLSFLFLPINSKSINNLKRN